MSNSSPVPLMSPSTPLICSKMPMPLSTSHRTTLATTVAMPSATDSRNDSLSTDQGSTLAIVRRAVRGPPAADTAPPPAVAVAGDGDDVSYEARADGGAYEAEPWLSAAYSDG